jgi:hypothetical protein
MYCKKIVFRFRYYPAMLLHTRKTKLSGKKKPEKEKYKSSKQAKMIRLTCQEL